MRSRMLVGAVWIGAGVGWYSPPAAAQTAPPTTRVMVRVVSHDAKAIGTGVGGARVTIRELATGKVLAQGIQEGSTGNTELIVTKPRERGRAVYDVDGTAGFLATLAISRPTQIEITGEGPLGTPHAMQKASKTMLAVPGQHALGDGIVLELHGFTVSLLSDLESARAGQKLVVRAKVTMLCGCPLTPGGLWDAERVEVIARLVQAGETMEVPLSYAGAPSRFEGVLALTRAGPASLEILALDPERGNFGRVSDDLVVGG